MPVLPWDLLVLLACVAEVVVVRVLMHRAFHRGYKAAKDVYGLGVHRDGSPCVQPGTGCNTRGCPPDNYWERQRTLAQEPKKA